MLIHSRPMLKLAALLLLVTTLICSGWFQGTVSAQTLPAPCTGSGSGTATCSLWAKPGTLALPGGASVPIWGYTDAAAGSATIPGPVLVVTQNDNVTIHLTNNLPEQTALVISGIDMVPDTTGAAPTTGTKDYTFVATKPGTYLYEAGLLPNAEHQVAMGLYGVLVVLPTAANQAYNTASSAFNGQAVVVLSEIDPALNQMATPAGFDMRNYHPTYYLINGKASPQTDLINVANPGDKVLLRYANAGLQPHSMGTLGLRQLEIAVDASPYTYPRSVVAEIIAPGQTADMLTTLPATAVAKYAIYDASMTLHNADKTFGGMITFMSVGTSATGPDTTGPTTKLVTLTPSRTTGAGGVQVAATVDDGATGGSNVTSADCFIDSLTTPCAGTTLAGTFGGPSVAVLGTIPQATLDTLAPGTHTIYVRGTDALGNVGPTNFAALVLDKVGPATTGLGLTPRLSSGLVNVTLTGTANDSANGNSNIKEAEYTIDGGAPQVITPNTTGSPIASLSIVIPPAAFVGLSEGAHIVSVRSRDQLDNWGAPETIKLYLDTTGPVASTADLGTVGLVPVDPTGPNNGTRQVSSSQPAVRVSVHLKDTDFRPLGYVSEVEIPDVPEAPGTLHLYLPAVAGGVAGGAEASAAAVGNDHTFLPSLAGGSDVMAEGASVNVASCTNCIRKAEGFIDTLGDPGTGFGFTAKDGVFNTPDEFAAVMIPLVNLAPLSEGTHHILVRGQDDAGNWGDPLSIDLVIEKTPPTVSALTLTPSTPVVQSERSVVINFTATDPAPGSSNIVAGEYFIDVAGANGSGTPLAVTPNGTSPVANVNGAIPAATMAALTPGNHKIYVHAKDAAGNWGSLLVADSSATFVTDRIFADTFASGDFAAWSSASTTTNNRLNVNAAATMGTVGTPGMRARANNNANYVQYNFGTATLPEASLYDARFYFNPNGATSSGKDIFTAGSTTASNTNDRFNGGNLLFRVLFRNNGNARQVQIVLNTAAAVNANWKPITNNASNRIEVVWSAATASVDGTLTLYVNGVQVQSLNLPLATARNQRPVSSVRMGSVTSTGNNAFMYFDEFASKRSASTLYSVP